MLHENKFVRQEAGGPRLRWFRSDYFDLFLWQNDAGDTCRFQLCYDLGRDEHALTWSRETNTLVHQGVDDGEEPGEYGASPILHSPHRLPPPELPERFRAASDSIQRATQEFILEILTKEVACGGDSTH